MTSFITLGRSVLRARIPLSATVGACLGVALAGCGSGATNTLTATPAASTSGPAVPAWEAGTGAPKVTAALIAQAGNGLTPANTKLGTVDEVFGALAATVHVNPSARSLNDQYARFGRCMGEYLRIHDLGHELALLVAYDRKNAAAQAAVEKASAICSGVAITPDAAYKQSLKSNP